MGNSKSIDSMTESITHNAVNMQNRVASQVTSPNYKKPTVTLYPYIKTNPNKYEPVLRTEKRNSNSYNDNSKSQDNQTKISQDRRNYAQANKMDIFDSI